MKNIILFLFAFFFLPFSCETPEKEEEVIYGSIEGYLYLDYRDNPYVGVDVMLSPGPHITLTDSKGYYRLGNIKEGNYTMSLYHSRDFIDEFPIYILAGNPSRLDMMYFSPEPPKKDLPDFSVVDISSEGVGWNYWVVGKEEYFYIDEENSRPKSVFYHSFKEDNDYGFFFNSEGLPEKVITQEYIYLFDNFNGNKVDMAIISPIGEIQIVKEIQTEFNWPSSFPSTKSTQSKADFIRWTGRIIGAIPCVASGAAAFVTGGATIPLALLKCTNYFLSLSSNFFEDAEVTNGFTEFYKKYNMPIAALNCTINPADCAISLAKKGLEEYADYVEELEERDLEIDKAVDLLNTRTLTISSSSYVQIGSRPVQMEEIECASEYYKITNSATVYVRDLSLDWCAYEYSYVFMEFPINLPEESLIKSATLEIYGEGYSFYSDFFTLSIYKVASNWDKSSISWSNHPGGDLISSKGFAEAVEGSIVPQLFKWEIDLDVQEWVDKGNNFGLLFTIEDNFHYYPYSDAICTFYTQDDAQTIRRPKLTIVYYPAEN